jgi:hypothetical protein
LEYGFVGERFEALDFECFEEHGKGI